MTAGLNLKATIWRMLYMPDDNVGGAVLSGTNIYIDVPIRIENMMQDQLLLQQGLETIKTSKGVLHSAKLDIRERDELEITWPPNHPHYGDRYRVIGIQDTNFHSSDHRGYLVIDLERSERAHAQQ